MIRLGMGLLAAAFFAACSSNGDNNGNADAGPDADIDPFEDPIVRVSGTAQVHPAAEEWLTSQAMDVPSLEGLTLRVQEPLRTALNDPDAVFGSVTLGADGTFSVDEVDTADVNVGIAAGILDERDGGIPEVVRTSTSIWDVQLREGKPEVDIAGAKAYALPKAFHDQLTQAIGTATILAATAQQFDTLISAGFLLGQVVDANGAPVAGALVEATDAQYTQRIWYPNETFTGSGQVGTSAHGLFVYIHPGTTEPSRFDFSVKDQPDYRQRSGGAAVNAGLLMIVYPGTEAP